MRRGFMMLIIPTLVLGCAGGAPPGPGPEGPSWTLVDVGEGDPPRLDGIRAEDEWRGARQLDLTREGRVELLRRGNKLYLGLHFNQKHATAALAFARGDEIKVCQISHLLATAVYKQEERRWHRSRDYGWVQIAPDDQRGIKEHLDRSGWAAVRGLPAEGRFYEICVTVPPEGLRLAVAKYGLRGGKRAAHWPPGMENGFVRSMLSGDQAPEFMEFMPDTWAQFDFPPPPEPAAAARPITSDAAIQGAWRVTEIRYVWEGGEAPIPEPQPGQFIFGDGGYSMVWHQMPVRQPDYETAWRPTDEERISAYNSIVVNSGSYELRGDTLITRPLVAKTVEFEGGEARWFWFAMADTLWLQSAEIWNRKGEVDPAVGEMVTEVRCERFR